MQQIETYCAICGDILRGTPGAPPPRCRCSTTLSVAPPPNERSLPDVPVFESELLSVEIRFRCGGCQQKLQVDAQCEGMTVACPTCQALTWVPKWQRAAESAEEARPAHDSFEQLTIQEIEFLSGVDEAGADSPNGMTRANAI